MLSSLDAALGSSSGPRAAAFKPKHKPRARKSDAGQAAETPQLGPGSAPAARASTLGQSEAHGRQGLLPGLGPATEVPGGREGSREFHGQLRRDALSGKGDALEPSAGGTGERLFQRPGGAEAGPASDMEGQEELGPGSQVFRADALGGLRTLDGAPPTRSLPVDSVRGTVLLDTALLAGEEGAGGAHALGGECMAREGLLEQYVEVPSPEQQGAGEAERAADPFPGGEATVQPSIKRRRRQGGAGGVSSEEGRLSVDRNMTRAQLRPAEPPSSPEMETRELRSGRRVPATGAVGGTADGYQDTPDRAGSAGRQHGGRGSRGKRTATVKAGGTGRGPARKGRASSAPNARPGEATVEGGGGAPGPAPASASVRRPGLPHGAPRGRRRAVETSVLTETDMGLLTLNQIIQRAEALEKMKEGRLSTEDDGREEGAEGPLVGSGGSGRGRAMGGGGGSIRGNGGGRPPPLPPPPDPDAALAPQVAVVDGRIVVNESTLSMSARVAEDTAGYRRVDESTPRLNYHTHLKIERAERWTPEETHRWFQALRQFGTDFEMLQCLFPGRSRRQMKAKFKKEERLNPDLITYALQHRPSTTDQTPYQQALGAINPELVERAQQMVQDSALGVGEYSGGPLEAGRGGREASQATEDSGIPGDSGAVDNTGPAEGATAAGAGDLRTSRARGLQPAGELENVGRPAREAPQPEVQTALPVGLVPGSGAHGVATELLPEQAGDGHGTAGRGSLGLSASVLPLPVTQLSASQQGGSREGAGRQAAPAGAPGGPWMAVEAAERPLEPPSGQQRGEAAQAGGGLEATGTEAPDVTALGTLGGMPSVPGESGAGPLQDGLEGFLEAKAVEEDDPFAPYA